MAPRSLVDELVIQRALLSGPANGSELALRLHAATGSVISQPTLSRKLARLAQQGLLLQVGEKRGRRNFWLRSLQGVTSWPVYQVFADGHAEQVGEMWRVYPGYAWMVAGEVGHSESLPWWLMDFLPQGYIGRALSTRYGVAVEAAGVWSEEDTLCHLGELDAAGDLLLGEAAYLTFVNAAAPAVPVALAELPAIAADLALQAIGGSSAGGEQPKFIRHVTGFGECLIKFSAEREQGANAQRWADLLVAEAVALAILQAAGITTPVTHLHVTAERHYLLSRRFDRLDNHGRCGVVSLKCLNAEFLGRAESSPWPELVQDLVELGMVNPDAVAQTELAWAFGVLIANTDMHAGNLSFLRTAPLDSTLHTHSPLVLAPVYDMLPMAYAPDRSGNRRHAGTLYLPRLTATVSASVWQQAAAMAERYWWRLRSEPALSGEFRAIADGALVQLQTQLQAAIGRMGTSRQMHGDSQSRW